MASPYIGITMGDPCGIGPEIIVKTLTDGRVYEQCRPVVIGDYSVLKAAVKICGLEGAVEINPLTNPLEGSYEPGILNIISLDNADIDRLEYGRVQEGAGRAAYEYIKKSVELCLEGKIAAVATAPVNKEALKAAGIKEAGHTEIFASLTGSRDPLTMFETAALRIFFLSRHVSLREACDLVKKERVYKYILKCCNALKSLGLKEGALAVAALNPHGGDNGLFGREELDEIIPAINMAREAGMAVEWPIGADSVFYQALQGKYSAVLAMYHDQGHVAAKTLDFEKTVSITLGLPFLRTSVDHGTAFDIAGSGQASPVSMTEAVCAAAKYVLKMGKKS